MYFTLFTFFMYIMTVIGYPASRFLIEIEEPIIGARLTKAVMIREDIQTHYENLLDEVISTHDEEFLLKMTYSMTSEKMESFYRPQANMLLDNRQSSIHEKCLYRTPHWIGKYLHDTHSTTYSSVSNMIEDYMDNHWPALKYQQDITPTDIKELYLVHLNLYLMTRIDQAMMDPITLLTDLSLKLQSCQQQHAAKDSFFSRMMIQLTGDCRDMKTRRFLAKRLANGDLKTHFLVSYLTSLRKDMEFQMDDRMMDLAELIYDDVNDDNVDY